MGKEELETGRGQHPIRVIGASRQRPVVGVGDPPEAKVKVVGDLPAPDAMEAGEATTQQATEDGELRRGLGMITEEDMDSSTEREIQRVAEKHEWKLHEGQKVRMKQRFVAETEPGPDPKRVIGLWRYRVALVVPSSEAAKAGRLQAHD